MYQVKTLFKAKTSIVIDIYRCYEIKCLIEMKDLSYHPSLKYVFVCLYLSIGFLLWLQISIWQKFPTRQLWVSFSQMSLMLTSLCPSSTRPWCFLLVRRWKKWQTLVSWAQHPPCHARCLGKRHLCKWVTSLWPTCTHNTPLNLFCFLVKVKVHPKMKTVFYKLFQTWGGSLLNNHQCAASTWMICWLPQDNGASVPTTHQLQVERRESHRANQVDGDY